MTYTHTIIGHFSSHTEAEKAVSDMQEEGFDMTKLSIIGKDYQTAEQVRGFLTWKDTAQAGITGGAYWGSFVGGLFGILVGAGVLFIPGMAPLIVAGPIAGVLAGWLEGTLAGGISAAAVGGLAGALGGLGISKNEIVKYETKIQAGEFVILVTGSNEDVDQAKGMLDKISHGMSKAIAR